MHLSKYSKTYLSDESEDSFFLFSTKRASIAEVPAALMRRIRRGRPIPAKDERLLRRLGFIVSDPKKEERKMLAYIDELNAVNRTLSVKVVMSLDCNLACRYCFEGNRKGKYYMSRETADELIEFVKKRRGLEEIHLVFYGGEPLLSKELIIYIAKKVKALAKIRRLRFGFSLQTNGTLLTKAVAKQLRPLGLQTAFITVDGPKECHDQSRPYKVGAGSFDRIMGNVRDVCKVIDVQISGNFTKDNYQRFPLLADFLIENGLGPGLVSSLRFFPVASESPEYCPPEFNDGCSSVNEPWFSGASLFLREEILQRRYSGERIAPGVCMMEHRKNILVNYNGDIYKCPGLIGRKEFSVGNLRDGIADYRASHHLDNWKNDECLGCAYLPLCFGGCRHMKLVREGTMDGVDCKRPFYDATLEALVKQDMKYDLIKK